ncbi:helix-turn-helix domain-containing protein [Streptomyces sp. NPDC005485]|uniref:helix-turn-helix domain-containing protein n=1 Tax=Streptomyces sp. NPDC005485 TaxID=3155591 RepID=UPI0033AEB48E
MRYGQARVAVLLASEPEVSADLVRDLLDALNAHRPDEQDLLLETLRGWYDAKGSTAEAAKRPHCQPNAVRYRLAKLRGATGRKLTEPINVAYLYLAMEAHRPLSPRDTAAWVSSVGPRLGTDASAAEVAQPLMINCLRRAPGLSA